MIHVQLPVMSAVPPKGVDVFAIPGWVGYGPRLCENETESGRLASERPIFALAAGKSLESRPPAVRRLAKAPAVGAFSRPIPPYARMASVSARTPSIVITRFML